MRKGNLFLQNKAHIRKILNEKRSAISAIDRERFADQAKNIFIQHEVFSSSLNIATYLAMKNEFDCFPLIQAIWHAKKNCYLPIVEHDTTLTFVNYQENDVLQKNRYQILEPINPQVFPKEQLDLVLMPLVGFDLQGNRLGMGKGYYDRTFEFLKDTSIKKPLLIGLAYECQCLGSLPNDAWDIPLAGVLTEQNLYVMPAKRMLT